MYSEKQEHNLDYSKEYSYLILRIVFNITGELKLTLVENSIPLEYCLGNDIHK